MELTKQRLLRLEIEPADLKQQKGESDVEELEFWQDEPDGDCSSENVPAAHRNRECNVETLAKTKSSKKRSFCTICNKYLLNIAEHYRMHQNIRKQQCPYCDKTFVHRSNFTSHLNIHTRERSYKCEHCCSEFFSVQGLKQHLPIHYEGQFSCTICNRKYIRKSYLRIHQERVHMPKQKHKCLICDREFINLTVKEEHMKIHKDLTLHACCICHRAYNARKNLLRHARAAHPEEIDLIDV